MTDSALHMLIEYNLDGFRHDASKLYSISMCSQGLSLPQPLQ